MFARKRRDTKVGTVERTYGIDLNARSDMLLGRILEERGFDSETQLVAAYRGQLMSHARRRRVFLSFHADDEPQVRGFRLMLKNPRVDLDAYDSGLREAIDSEQGAYIKSVLRDKIGRASVVLCLIGNGTAGREWVDWELKTAWEMRKGIAGARLKGSRGRTPPVLGEIGAPVAAWGVADIVAVIESAAARRS